MERKGWKYFIVLFHLVCWASAISVIFYRIYLFSLNEDLTVIDYKRYHHDDSYKYPMLSLCFKNPFNNARFEEMSTKINATSYLEFLEGKHFRTDILQYDYQNIINNISAHVVNYWSVWGNSTSQLYKPTNYGFDQFKSTFAGFFAHEFYNCYGLKMPDDQEMVVHSVELRNDVFPSKIRPQAYDFFTILHYPNHLMKSVRNRNHNWDRRTPNDTYEMQFVINDVEVVKRRNKNKHPCNQTGNDYDNSVLLKHSDFVGCRE